MRPDGYTITLNHLLIVYRLFYFMFLSLGFRLFDYTVRNWKFSKSFIIFINLNLQETLDEHVFTRTKGDAPRDYIDVYRDLIDEQSQMNSNSTFSRKSFSDKDSYNIIFKIKVYGLRKQKMSFVLKIYTRSRQPHG
jgi:hypothetical protein